MGRVSHRHISPIKGGARSTVPVLGPDWLWEALAATIVLRMEKHPDKTFIGRIERGFDFLGYHFGPEGLSVAKTTIENFVERAIRLYEQEPGSACASTRFGEYVRRWVRWTTAGLAVAGIPAPIGAAAG